MTKMRMWPSLLLMAVVLLLLAPLTVLGQTAMEVREEMVEQVDENIDAVIQGDATLPEGTRDIEESVDLGANQIIPFLFMFFGSVVKPAVMVFIEKRPNIDNRLVGAINVVVLVLFYLTMWALLHNYYPQISQDPLGFVFMGLGAAGLGDGLMSLTRTIKGKLDARNGN